MIKVWLDECTLSIGKQKVKIITIIRLLIDLIGCY